MHTSAADLEEDDVERSTSREAEELKDVEKMHETAEDDIESTVALKAPEEPPEDADTETQPYERNMNAREIVDRNIPSIPVEALERSSEPPP